MSQKPEPEQPGVDKKEDDQIVNPWKVSSKNAIDYMKLIDQFGCEPTLGSLIERFERITKYKAHTWLRRGIYFSNKDLTKTLDAYERGEQVYLYTGRGPSSESMHLGHMVPFVFTKYLQDAFDAILVVQMSDDEKFYFKSDLSLEEANRLARENAKDIIACGFNPNKTFIFSNLETVGGELYKNVVLIMNTTTGNQIRGIFGLTLDNSIGQLSWPAFQAAPAFSSSFPDVLSQKGNKQITCLVPMAIDQSPYFGYARDFAARIKGYLKPSEIHAKFLPGLTGPGGKMSSTGESANSLIYMTDKPKDIRKKIVQHAFSGGGATKEEHIKNGGNLENDMSYQYLVYFMDDDKELAKIAHSYRSGKMMSGEIKNIMADTVCSFIDRHQRAREKVTPQVIDLFFNRNRKFDTNRTNRDPVKLDDDYSKYGINFDQTFGAVAPNPQD